MQVSGRPIVINRSSRYHNLLFPWRELVANRGHQMIFVGADREHEDFVRQFGFVPRFETATLLDVARLIAGSRMFIGNQSCPMAIALGLGANVIQETWDGEHISLGDLDVPWGGQGDANCVLKRENALYIKDGHLNFPESWL